MSINQRLDQLSSILNQELGVHGNNCKTVIDFTLSLQKSRTVNLSQMSNYSMRVGEISSDSIYKNYQRLVRGINISQTDLARCIIRMFDLVGCKLTLALDRTNWKYGNNNINLLVLSVCVLDIALPLYWIELDKRGNSNTAERITLVDQFIAEFGAGAIDYILADREFIGEDWLNYLQDYQIKFTIRIKANMLVEFKNETIKSGKLFSKVSCNNRLTYTVIINGIILIAQAVRSKDNQLVIIATNDLLQTDLLKIYAKRWRIECLFAALKSKGFNFEDTHITNIYRIGNLTKLIVLAFSICYLLGLVKASIKPIIIKKHGYKQNSYFRYGLDCIIQKLHSNFKQAISIITLCFSYIDMEQKCKKLISVL